MIAEKTIARAILDLCSSKLRVGTIAQISAHLHHLKSLNSNVVNVTLQRTPIGFYSQEVSAFVGRLLTVGLANCANPLILTQEGVDWLEHFVDDEG